MEWNQAVKKNLKSQGSLLDPTDALLDPTGSLRPKGDSSWGIYHHQCACPHHIISI